MSKHTQVGGTQRNFAAFDALKLGTVAAVLCAFVAAVLLFQTLSSAPKTITVSSASKRSVSPPSFVLSKNRAIDGANIGESQNDAFAQKRKSEDWFEAGEFARHRLADSCVYFENVCSNAQQFFVPFDSNVTFALDLSTESQPAKYSRKGFRSEFVFGSEQWPAADSAAKQQCEWLQPANHLVLHYAHMQMLGHFYNDVMRHYSSFFSEFNGSMQTRMRDTQFYLLQWAGSAPLNSQQLLANAFSQWPLRLFDDLLANIRCRCHRRLIFCGVRAEAMRRQRLANGTVVTRPLAGAPKRHANHIRLRMATMLSVDSAAAHRNERNYLRQWLQASDRNLLADTRALKLRIVTEHLRRTNASETLAADLSQWKLVGLTKRTSRRKWQNLQSVIEACNEQLAARFKVLCLAVNLETFEMHPRNHALWHFGLDMTVGIHGAQLTHGIWMADHRFVVELLPYVPHFLSYGQWTRTLHKATPLGEIFKGTELNHFGYRLPMESVPAASRCKANASDCWSRQRWDSRDFEVDWSHLRPLIHYALIDGGGFCRSHRQGIDGKQLAAARLPWMQPINFTIYNAKCPDSDYIYEL